MASSWSWVTWMKVRPTSVLDPLDLDLHRPAQLEVERAERLVEEQHLGAVDQGPGQRDPLLLAAGELGRLLPGLAAELDEVEHLAHLGVDVALLAATQPEGDVLVDVEVREERVALEHRVDRPLVGLGVGDVVAGQRDRARAGRLQTGHHPQRGRLAAARTGRAARRTSPSVRRGPGRGRRRTRRSAGSACAAPARRTTTGRPAPRRRPHQAAPQPPVTSANSPSYLVASASSSGLMSIVIASISGVGKISSFSTSEGSIFSISSCAPWTGQM